MMAILFKAGGDAMIGEASSVCSKLDKGSTIEAQSDRRRSARFLLREVRGKMDWRMGAGQVAHLVDVMNISGGGAAVQVEEAPEPGQEVGLRIDHERWGLGRVTAIVQAVEAGESGSQIVRLRFARWIRLDWMMDSQRDRRLWERYPARESQALLTWLAGSNERTVRGELLNISGGGAAITADVLPPPGVRLWFLLEAGIRRSNPIDPVESRLVTRSVDPCGRHLAHLQFLDPCPMDLFELAVNGSAEEDGI